MVDFDSDTNETPRRPRVKAFGNTFYINRLDDLTSKSFSICVWV